MIRSSLAICAVLAAGAAAATVTAPALGAQTVRVHKERGAAPHDPLRTPRPLPPEPPEQRSHSRRWNDRDHRDVVRYPRHDWSRDSHAEPRREPLAGSRAVAGHGWWHAGGVAARLPEVFGSGRIRSIGEDGRRVALGDGSEWEVAPEDRPTSDGWRAGDVVVLRRIAAPTGPYEYRLVNPDAESEIEQGAAVRLIGR